MGFYENRCGEKMPDDEFIPFSTMVVHHSGTICIPHYLIRKTKNPSLLWKMLALSAKPCGFFIFAGWWHEVVPDQVRWNSPELSFCFHMKLNERQALEPDAVPLRKVGRSTDATKNAQQLMQLWMPFGMMSLCDTQTSQNFAAGAIFDEIVSNCEEKVF